MKVLLNKSHLFLLAILFFLPIFSYSQNNLQRLTESSDVVIEGKVTYQEFFKSQENGFIYTKNHISIHKIFKDNRGKIIDQLTIVTKGGTLNGRNESWSHNFTLSMNETGVFFLKTNEKFNESFRVVEGINGFIAYRNYGTNNPIGNAPNKIYYHLENDIFKPLEAITNHRTFVALNEYEKELLEHSIGLTSNECVEYKISDVEITTVNNLANVTTSYSLEFDIDIRALQNIFDLRRTELKMEYSTSILGDYIVGNNNIIVTLGGDLGNYQLTLFDDSANKVGVDIEKIQNAIAIEIDNYYKGLYHAIIEIQNFDLSAILQLTVDENFDLKTFKEDGNSSVEISCNEFNENINVVVNQLLPPEIDSWTMDVTAGTRTMLTITGDNFGTSQFDSEVWFRNAYNHSLVEWVKPFSGDYESWSNTEIKVYVPTYAQSSSSSGPIGINRNYAGSGLFKVVKFDGEDEKNLTVTYATTNDIRNSKSQPIFLTKENNNNGYTVTYTDAFKAKTDGPNNNTGNKFKDAFERALNTWCMETGLNYTIDEDAYQNGNGNWDILVDIQNDPISFTTPASTLTPRYDTNCNVTIDNGSNNHPEVFESDFIQSSTITFWDDSFNALWDAGPITNQLHSVEKISLHELGHAHGILHTNNENELMYYSPTMTTVLTSEAISASNYIQDHSEDHNCQNGNYQRKASCTTGIKNIAKHDAFLVSALPNNIVILNPNQLPVRNFMLSTTGGVVVSSLKPEKDLEFQIPINQQLPAGIYFLTIYMETGEVFTYKLPLLN